MHAGRQSAVQCRFLDANLAPIGRDLCIPVSSSNARAEASPLADSSVVLAWSDKDRILARRADRDGFAGSVLSLARNYAQVPQLEVQTFASQEIAISWQHALVIIPTDDVPLLSETSLDAWHATAILVAPDLLLRVHTNEVMVGASPIYPIIGSYYGADARGRGKFTYSPPTRIVDNTYAHPEHLTAVTGADGCAIAWTDLAHHRGNSIQAVKLCNPSDKFGSQVLLAAAPSDEHMNFPTLVRITPNELIGAWSHSDQKGCKLVGRRFSNDLTPIGETFTIATALNQVGSLLADEVGGALAVWAADGQILASRLERSDS